MFRWKKVLQSGLNKGHWTAQEDKKVRRAVAAAEAIGGVRRIMYHAIYFLRVFAVMASDETRRFDRK